MANSIDINVKTNTITLISEIWSFYSVQPNFHNIKTLNCLPMIKWYFVQVCLPIFVICKRHVLILNLYLWHLSLKRLIYDVNCGMTWLLFVYYKLNENDLYVTEFIAVNKMFSLHVLASLYTGWILTSGHRSCPRRLIRRVFICNIAAVQLSVGFVCVCSYPWGRGGAGVTHHSR